jgi:hypothetical protein
MFLLQIPLIFDRDKGEQQYVCHFSEDRLLHLMDVKTNLSGFQMAKNKNGCQTI